MKTLSIIVIVSSFWAGFAQADPEDFITETNPATERAADSIFKRHTIYIDRDGTVYVKGAERLEKEDAHNFSSLLKLSRDIPGNGFQIYIHPEAQWKNVQKTLTRFPDEGLGVLLRTAKLKPEK